MSPARRVAAPCAGRVLVVAALLVALGACGKRGAPLPPLPRLPGAVAEFSALRSDDVVSLSLVVPSTNVSGDTPGDIAAVEIYAITARQAPALEAGRIADGLRLVTSLKVRRPLPPLPKDAPATLPTVPLEPGLDQGARTTVREQLTAAERTPVVPATAAPAAEPGARLSLPLVHIDPSTTVKRHYVAVAVSRRGARGAWSAVRSVPVGPVSGAPSSPVLTYDAATVTLAWTAAPDARSGATEEVEGVLASRPLGAAATATRYNVYAVDSATTDAASIDPAARLNPQPVAATTVSAPGVVFGQTRCFVVRGVDTLDGVDVEGPASPAACLTPADTFPPAAPTALEAVGGAGVISLIWEGVDDADLGGYLVLRGDAGTEPSTLLTATPIRGTSFEDRTVTPGTRYGYVVVAIDSATPPNRSGPSNRAEETARQ